MPKKSKPLKVMNLVPIEMLDNLVVESLNLTTSSEETYKIVSSDLSSSSELSIDSTYGSGPLAYTGKSNQSQTLFTLESQALSNKSYLVRGIGNEACAVLKVLVDKSKDQLTDLKISSSQAIGAIDLTTGINVSTLIQDASQSQQTLRSQNKISVTPDNIFEIGTKTSSKFIQIAVAKTKSSPSKPCLSITTRVKESSVKFCTKLSTHNLDVTDIHPLVLRDIFEQLNDCDLKNIVLSFIKQTFSLPSKDKLKAKKVIVLPSKVKYFQSAVMSSLKYLDDETLKEATSLVIKEYLASLSAKGFAISQPVDQETVNDPSRPSTPGSAGRGKSKQKIEGGNVE